MTVGPNLRPDILLARKGIIGRHRTVIVQTQNFSCQGVEFLRQLALRCVTRRDVELAVGSKSQTATSVKLRRRNVLDNDFPIGESGRCFAITHYPDELAAGI